MSTLLSTSPDFEAFFNAYLTAALWSSTISDGEEDDKGPWEGDNFDSHFGISDFTPEAREVLHAHCLSFWSRMHYYLAQEEPKFSGDRAEQAGHAFWLTSNGHGAGFWDGDWPMYGGMLTKLSKCYPEIDLSMTDDRTQVCI